MYLLDMFMHGSILLIVLSDRDRLAVNVNNDEARPVTVPQTKRSPRLGTRSPKSKQRSPKLKSRSKQPVPDIEITYANVNHDARPRVDEPIYDNAQKAIYMNIGKPGEIYRPEREDIHGLYMALT